LSLITKLITSGIVAHLGRTFKALFIAQYPQEVCKLLFSTNVL